MDLPFHNSYARLPEHFFSKQLPAKVPAPELIRLNTTLAEDMGIFAELSSPLEILGLCSGNTLPASADPLAQAYAGHQFGGFSPQLGDGRALLIGEIVTPSGKRLDLQLKGSGRTAFSRGGDGKSALGPVLREFIVSEYMHHIGVPTTRALAAVSTGESVHRQEGPLPGGILTRVASSHIRVGTFQYFYAKNDSESVKQLADYVIARHYPDAASYLELLERVIQSQAKLIAHWMSLGFIHGVMNTDNCAVSGETIDYGPCAFMDHFHPEKVFSSIDRQGRYAWANQSSMGYWNLCRFAETLLTLIHPDQARAIEIAGKTLKSFAPICEGEILRRFREKLCLPEDSPESFIDKTLELLAHHSIDFTLFFSSLTRFATGDCRADLTSLFGNSSEITSWLSQWEKLSDPTTGLSSMTRSNPTIIPRNHQIERVIQAAYTGDFTPFHALSDALQAPYSRHSVYEKPPLPSEQINETFCGT